MYCPNCNSENSDSAKFCKKCGTPLKKTIDHQNMIKTINNEKVIMPEWIRMQISVFISPFTRHSL